MHCKALCPKQLSAEGVLVAFVGSYCTDNSMCTGVHIAFACPRGVTCDYDIGHTGVELHRGLRPDILPSYLGALGAVVPAFASP